MRAILAKAEQRGTMPSFDVMYVFIFVEEGKKEPHQASKSK